MTRVLVTGIGAVTPCGRNVSETWNSLLEGKSGISSVTRFPLYDKECKAGGAAVGFKDIVPGKESIGLQMAAIAVDEAMEHGGLSHGEVDGLVLANHGERTLNVNDPNKNVEVLGVQGFNDALAKQVGVDRGLAVYAACAGGSLAVGMAMRLLQSGRYKRIIAGGVDSMLRDMDFYQFCNLYTMSARECPPEEASAPFDARRDGFVMAEGAAFLILETEESANERGAEALAEMSGFGYTQNAYNVIASPPNGSGSTMAMANAIKEAKINKEDVDYLNAHGTATKDNDWAETQAIHNVFGDYAPRLAVSSTKSMLGHAIAAAGAIEAAICVEALVHQAAPPTINQFERDPKCDLDYVPWTGREMEINHVLSNSSGFGGHNASLAFSRI